MGGRGIFISSCVWGDSGLVCLAEGFVDFGINDGVEGVAWDGFTGGVGLFNIGIVIKMISIDIIWMFLMNRTVDLVIILYFSKSMS